MTTIAWDKKTLAVDSQETGGSTITTMKVKKLFLDVGRFKAIAFTGTSQDAKSILRWVEHEDEKQPKFDEHFVILAIDDKGKCHRLHKSDIAEFTQEAGFVAEGSGADIAIGAMDAGASAIEAIKITCKRDIYTGGKIQSYTHEVVK